MRVVSWVAVAGLIGGSMACAGNPEHGNPTVAKTEPDGATNGRTDGGGIADSPSANETDGSTATSADGSSPVGDAVGSIGEAGLNLVTPTQTSNDGNYSFSFGDVVFEVDSQIGARVAVLTLGTVSLVEQPVRDLTQWGSTFWTSPQSDWKPSTWPPPASIDADPYTGGPSGGHLVLTSAEDPTTGISVTKDYSVDGTSGWIHITYTILATTACSAAPWEDTRVPRGGLAFFPAGTSLDAGPLTMTATSGIEWFDDSSETATSQSGSKAIADGSGGWTAYAVQGVLFLKKFTATPANDVAPGEGSVEIYPGSGFLELETQGPYTSIPANGSLPWSMDWRVVTIPSSVTVAPGSSTLVTFAEQQAAM